MSHNNTPMSRIQQKNHTKSQKNLNLNEKRQPTYANSKMTQILELLDKEPKAAVLKMLQQTMMNTLETNEQIESFSKETEDTKGHQTEILERKGPRRGSTAGWRQERKESLNLKTKQKKQSAQQR